MDEHQTPAAGNDVDSRKRTFKQVMAAAEASGDDHTADAVREELDALNEEAARGQAAARRKAAAEAAGPDFVSSPPQGRAAPNKATTKAATKTED